VPLDCRRLLDALHRNTAAKAGRVTEMWQAPQPSPEALRAFTRAMHAHSFSLAMRVIDRFDLRGVKRLLDVGGGSGSYSIAAIRRDPDVTATVLDLPVVCEMATGYAAELGAADRLHTAPLDMFAQPWPNGFDRVMMCDIFHDWADAQCRQLADRAFTALQPGGKVLLHEMLVADDKDGPIGALAYSMVMLFVAQGRQRTAGELSAILTAAGFTDVSVATTAGGYAAIAGTKP
jgi:acetylserotonin N-methyltransferase